uniref:nucleoporin NUP42 n=1 Tax=Oncorhynchus gorbuscha TaxID=8017 RepID=UPI001EAF4C49|nr:nucleoporin NUP42 [Oncorhynchus gorbuscha]
MPVCNFWMQGRCRYGDKCWNEHPKAGGGGYGGEYNSRPPQQSNRGGGGGFGNRVWVNPAQRSGGGNYVQPSSFSSQQGGNNWGPGGGGGGGRDSQAQSSNFSFAASSPNQNRFSALNTQSSFDKGGRGEGEDNEKHLETIQKDMEIWETSGQWLFSCYSVLKATISGFTELSPEELRLEYYNTKPSGDLQGYANVINQLVNQWRSRVQELRAMSGNTRVAMLAELDNPAPQAASGGFGSTPVAGFGSTPVTGFGSSAPSGFGTGFGVPAQVPVQDTSGASNFSFAGPGAASAALGSAASAVAPAPTGIGSMATTLPSAAGFSFATPAANKEPTTAGFGAPASASGFSFTSTVAGGGGAFGGSGFGSAAPVAASGFGQASGGFGVMAPADSLFTPQSQLSEEELKEFGGKRFTLGQIPLKPPPVNMLVV